MNFSIPRASARKLHCQRYFRAAAMRTAILQFILLTAVATTAAAQAPLQRFATGRQPVGIDTVLTVTDQRFAVVANSGDNSLSIFRLDISRQNMNVVPVSTVIGIPAPFAVADCGSGRALVTSPTDNAVRLIEIPGGRVIARIATGPEPHSATCFIAAQGSTAKLLAAVSNAGDNSLYIFDTSTLEVQSQQSGIPSNRYPHGIKAAHNRTFELSSLGVAGSEANVVSLISPLTATVFLQIPVNRPTSVSSDAIDATTRVVSGLQVASAGDNKLFGIDRITGQVVGIVSDVPNPIDALSTRGGVAAVLGGMNAVWTLTSESVQVFPDVPGATALTLVDIRESETSTNLQQALLVTSRDSNSMFLIYLPPSTNPAEFSLSHAASFAAGSAAAGQLVSLFGSTGISQNFPANSIPLPRTLGGVSVRLGGAVNFNAVTGRWDYSSTNAIQAPLLFVGPNQVNFQVPPGVPLGDAVPVQLTRADGTTLLSTVRITASAPGIFSVLQNGQGQGAVLNENSSQNFGTNPARRGSVVQIFATGAGETTPALLAGEAAPASGVPLILTNTQPTVNIGGQAARVQFSGMAPGYVGLWQINAEVPAGVTPGTAVPLTVTAGGVTSNTVTIAVE